MLIKKPLPSGHRWIYYRPRSKGGNTFGSVRPSVCTFACMRSPAMGSACRVLRKNTMTHEIQSKTSVCLSVIKERLRSKSCAQRSGAFNLTLPLLAYVLARTSCPRRLGQDIESPILLLPLRTDKKHCPVGISRFI